MENKKFVVTIVILIIIILGLGGFIALDKFVINKKDDDTITQIGDEEINLRFVLEPSILKVKELREENSWLIRKHFIMSVPPQHNKYSFDKTFFNWQ